MEQEPTGFFFSQNDLMYTSIETAWYLTLHSFFFYALKEHIKNQSDTQISYKLSLKLLNLH